VSTGELGLILATVGVAVGGGGWKIGAGLIELSRIVDKLGIEVNQIHQRMVRVEAVIERIAPPTIKWPNDNDDYPTR
jgi:hypothetical protein